MVKGIDSDPQGKVRRDGPNSDHFPRGQEGREHLSGPASPVDASSRV